MHNHLQYQADQITNKYITIQQSIQDKNKALNTKKPIRVKTYQITKSSTRNQPFREVNGLFIKKKENPGIFTRGDCTSPNKRITCMNDVRTSQQTFRRKNESFIKHDVRQSVLTKVISTRLGSRKQSADEQFKQPAKSVLNSTRIRQSDERMRILSCKTVKILPKEIRNNPFGNLPILDTEF